MSKVREVITAPKGEAFIVLADQNQLKVSRTYGAALRARLPKTA
jgi:DNA-binding LytR/AlgR family response regulator